MAQSFADAHGQLISGRSSQPVSTPQSSPSSFMQAHDALIQQSQTKSTVQPTATPSAKPIQSKPQQAQPNFLSNIGGVFNGIVGEVGSILQPKIATDKEPSIKLPNNMNLRLVNAPKLALDTSQTGGQSAQMTVTPKSMEQQKAVSKTAKQGLDAVTGVFHGTLDQLQQTYTDPLGVNAWKNLQKDPKKVVDDFLKTVPEAYSKIQPLAMQTKKDVHTNAPLSQTAGDMFKTIAAQADFVFSPLSAIFGAADKVPVLGTLAKLLTLPFTAAGEAGAGVTGKIIDALPIPQQAKNNLKPGLQEIVSLAAQLMAGHAMDITAEKKTALVEKYGAKDAKIIIDKAQEIVNDKTIEPGTYAPQELRNKVFEKKIEETPHGRDIIKATLTADQAGKHIEINKQLTPYDTPDVMKARSEQDKITSTHTIDTPERKQLREKVADELYQNGGYHSTSKRPTNEVKSEKRADIVTGLPASGKNTVISDPLVKEHGAILVDSDEAKMGIPESAGGKYNGASHLESTQIHGMVFNKALEKGNNVVIPLIGRTAERVISLAQKLKNEGYTVHLHHNEVSVETSAKRAVERYTKTGKFVDPNYIVNDVGLKPNENYDTIKKNTAFSTYEKFNNDTEGEKAKLIDQGTNESGRPGDRRTNVSAGQTGNAEKQTTDNRIIPEENPKIETKQFDKQGNEVKGKGFKKILTGNEVVAIRDVMEAKFNHVRETAKTPKDYQKGIDALAKDIIDRSQGDKVVLSALRTELNKEMYQVAGAGGSYKEAYAQLQSIRTHDPEMGALIDTMDAHIKGLDEKILNTPDKNYQAPAFVAERTKKQTLHAGSQEPTGTGKQKTSRAYERVLQHLEETDPELYNKVKDDPKLLRSTVNQKYDFENAEKIVAENPQKAYEIAKQLVPAPVGQRWESVNIVLADRALAEKNITLWKDLEQSRSLAQTRAGQGIYAERGRFDDNSPHVFVQKVLDARLKRLGGTNPITATIDTAKRIAGRAIVGAKEKGVIKIDEAVKRAQEFTAKQRSKIDFAQKLLDELTCK